jgi:hypothetical protein
MLALIAAAPVEASTPIQWRSPEARAIAQPVMTAADAAAAMQTLAATPDSRHVVVQFSAPLDATVRRDLANAGLHVQASLGARAYTARIDADRLDAARLAAVPTLQLAMPLAPEMKLHRDFASGDPGDVPSFARSRVPDAHGEPPRDVVAAYVLFHRDIVLDDAAALLAGRGGTVVSRIETLNGLVVEMPLDQVHGLAEADATLWIEPPLPPMEGVNDSNREVVQAAEVQEAPYGLDGSGVVVLVYDTGGALDLHPDFSGRLTVHDNSGVTNHSTHVAGTIGGDGALSPDNRYRGMAPGVTMLSYGFEQAGGPQPGFLYSDPGDLEDDYQDAINNRGAVVSNNSIGTNTSSNGYPCEWEGDYGVTSALIDSIVRGDLGAPMRIIWANGNERSSPANCGSNYHTTAPPACAKNHLTIGALNSDDLSVSSFTSWGPADDGRLKPDLAAPGCQTNDDFGVTSCSSGGSYTTMCGTSMAAPTATGCAALLLQDFRAQFPNRPDPLPSTLKALLVHNALDLGNPGPDYQSGFGMIQVRSTIDFARTGSFAEGEVDQGGAVFFIIHVPTASAESLKVTLAWDDVPGTPLVDPALVNDLDLLVTGPGGTYYPWTLDPSMPDQPAARFEPDHVNNIEQVLIDVAAPGQYLVQVSGFDVADGPQRFSVTAGPELVHTSVRLVGEPTTLVAPGEPTLVTASVIPVNETVVADSPMLHYQLDGGGFESVPLVPVGGDLYEGILPTAVCDDQPSFYLSVEGSTSGASFDPPGAPSSPYWFDVGADTEIFADDFESDLGWLVINSPGLDDGAWQRGVPAGDGTRGDPTNDADGSGQCYLTNNAGGNTDVDGGSTSLRSPILDASQGTAILSYYRWYSNVAGSAPNEDIFEVDVSDDGGATWSNLETIGPAGAGTHGGWVYVERDLADLPGFMLTDQLQVRFTASDLGSGSVVEAGVDGVRLISRDCVDVAIPCVADVASPADGEVGILDLLALLVAWDTADPDADIAPAGGDGIVSILDLLLLLSEWGPCP